MPAPQTAYLVVRRDDGYGDVFPLTAGGRFTLGRGPTNRIVLKDELCSREHAEVYQSDGRWVVRDLDSLNGTRLNGLPVNSERPLEAQDEVQVGRSRLVFVEDVQQLPDLPKRSRKPDDKLAIRKRIGSSRFEPTATHGEGQATVVQPSPAGRHKVEQDLAMLYRFAVRMGEAATPEELVNVVLDGLFDAVPAEVGAILALRENRELDLLAYRHRDPKVQTYHKVSQFVSSEVLSAREAILAEDVAADADLRNRESLAELRASSLICAPIVFEDHVLGLVHLYSITPDRRLDSDDLEFTVALARQLGAALRRLQEQSALKAENQSLRDQLYLESELVGASSSIKEVESQIARVAATQATVLIRGESGVGKELVARAIHFSSPRRGGPFVCLNCAALTETLLESELFGHERGAFTGATEKLIGKFESADRGTIFLDEIGEMNLGTQSKFLRVLEGHPFERVGGNTPIKVSVRVVAATNQGLEQAVRAGTFRRDLFFRLQVVEMRVPPLRDRPDDIPVLAEHFLKRFVRETGRRIKGFTPAAVAKLRDYQWPGNVRELRNVIERSVALGLGPMLDADDLWLSSLDLTGSSLASGDAPYRERSLDDVEKEHIQQTLKHTDWNKFKAAKILNINRSTLDRKIEGYDLKK
ncbi:MAG TPA: sigma 54-interacting transcriptional regulator [Gemmataceae bacterium]|jgi:transcriptional regulator with GAF, ATPase, and Fis domain|nr:sigma 54-interacting transcriptional regulator [Gemmataceae bacterium]